MPDRDYGENKSSKIGITKLGSRTLLAPKGSITNIEIKGLDEMIKG